MYIDNPAGTFSNPPRITWGITANGTTDAATSVFLERTEMQSPKDTPHIEMAMMGRIEDSSSSGRSVANLVIKKSANACTSVTDINHKALAVR